VGLQDSSLKVRREFIQVSLEPFTLPKPADAAAISGLETPSGQPYHCFPQEPPHEVTGSFAVFNYTAKSVATDPAVESFTFGFRDAGEDFGGAVTCECDAFVFMLHLLGSLKTQTAHSF
jgi:hypothetical protein